VFHLVSRLAGSVHREREPSEHISTLATISTSYWVAQRKQEFRIDKAQLRQTQLTRVAVWTPFSESSTLHNH
jgi:hypothetical protein